jgi:hypothetical protein
MSEFQITTTIYKKYGHFAVRIYAKSPKPVEYFQKICYAFMGTLTKGYRQYGRYAQSAAELRGFI